MWRFIFDSGKLCSRKKDLQEHAMRPIDIITSKKPKNTLTVENKRNTEQQQNRHTDRPPNS